MEQQSKNQNRAPLFEALEQFVAQNPLTSPVPAHKSGTSGVRHHENPELFACLPPFGNLMPYDLTELPGLDDLHAPSGAIAEAQQLAADLYGSDHAYFLVGGSTVGNLAFILATCAKNDLVIVDRNAHKSILHGLMLAEAQAVFIDTDTVDGIPQGPNVQQLLAAIEQYPQAKAILITRPTYYGTVVELKEIIAAAQKKNMVVFVDEAHGAHLGLHPALPQSALQLGADVVVQSTHKMLPAMTMSAMLHIQGTRAPKQRIEQHLRILQSSSPSYPLLASIDLARRYAAVEAPQQIDKSIEKINAFLLINKQPLNADPFKWVLRDPTGTYSGYELYNKFVEHGIYPELADPTYVVFYFGLETSDEALARLQEVLDQIVPEHDTKKPKDIHIPESAIFKPIPFSRQLFDQPATAVALEDAIGQKVAEMVIPYPPGVAMLFPGEIITATHIEQLKHLQAAKAHVQGVADTTLNTIRIFREEDIR